MTTAATSSAARRLKWYERGATTVFACRYDARFSSCLYVPASFDAGSNDHALVVAVHGSSRTATEFRDGFAAFAEAHRCVILAPLFPVGVMGDDNGDGFKYLVERTIRYDQVLLHMVAEAGARLGTAWHRFFLFGFSGGAQFANRFLLLHPGRLWGASIAAPGSVTLLDETRGYWVGTADVGAVFGLALDMAALRTVPVQVIVGEDDIDTWEINYMPGQPGYQDGINDTGRTRIERSRALQANLAAHGVPAELSLVPGAAHDWHPLMSAVQTFCRGSLPASPGATGDGL